MIVSFSPCYSCLSPKIITYLHHYNLRFTASERSGSPTDFVDVPNDWRRMGRLRLRLVVSQATLQVGQL